MQVLLDRDEAWSLMMLMSAYVIDHAGISQEGKQRIRRWRSDRTEGSPAMEKLTEALNRAIGAYYEEKTTRTIRRHGRYESSKEVEAWRRG